MKIRTYELELLLIDKVCDFFDEHEEEHHKFERIPVEERLASRADLHGLILLDHALPSKNSGMMISCAEHDEVWFDVDLADLGEMVGTEEGEAILLNLIRCGFRFDRHGSSLCKFV